MRASRSRVQTSWATFCCAGNNSKICDGSMEFSFFWHRQISLFEIIEAAYDEKFLCLGLLGNANIKRSFSFTKRYVRLPRIISF